MRTIFLFLVLVIVAAVALDKGCKDTSQKISSVIDTIPKMPEPKPCENVKISQIIATPTELPHELIVDCGFLYDCKDNSDVQLDCTARPDRNLYKCLVQVKRLIETEAKRR